jgi:anti-anti-sigma factor
VTTAWFVVTVYSRRREDAMCPAGIDMAILDVDVRRHGAHYLLHLAGELDLSSAPLLEARIVELEYLVSCVVDLHDLDFLDCAGARALVKLSQTLIGRGGRLVVIRPKPLAAKVLKIVGPGDLLLETPCSEVGRQTSEVAGRHSALRGTPRPGITVGQTNS